MGENICVKQINIPELKKFNGQLFPLVLSPAEPTTFSSTQDVCEWLSASREDIRQKLLQYGAIFFRGFPLKDAYDFDKFVTAYGLEALPYVGGAAPRRVITDKVFTANEAPPDKAIPFHHEMAQVPTYPSVLFFFCEKAPPTGGQTSMLLSNLVYERMLQKHPQFIEDLIQKKIIYNRVLPDGDDETSPIGRGWQSTYQTTDRVEAERRCKDQGYTSYEWLPDGCMRTVTQPFSPVMEDARTGKKILFHSLIAPYRGWKDARNVPEKALTFADGSLLPADVMDDLELVMEELAVDVSWREGDVYLVDNRQVMHARRPFTPPRLILASLAR